MLLFGIEVVPGEMETETPWEWVGKLAETKVTLSSPPFKPKAPASQNNKKERKSNRNKSYSRDRG